MLFGKAFFASASLITCALAQARLAFESVPAVAVTGETYNITWGGGDGSAVTITLRKGDPNDLTTVGILGEGISRDFFEWEVSDSLKPDDDYALQITQGQDAINYSGLFTINAGNGTTSNSTTTAAGNSTASITSTGTLSAGTGTALPRNTTFISPTISATTSLEPGTTQHASTSSSSRATSSSAPTAAATTGAPNSGEAGQLASSMALVMGVFAAVMFSS
ncbi:hypothetical protein LTR84_012697 [Exophiala bonariae]|uniref:Yeast cell wall synthesis Kre9/Knh1-like N-terminal domain-containing protein n=1 Tax=Exophiala bonariae TaxID=1690606 RepID=A0AAV9NF28_9EURO|nr:hypothetical protein LTR84_012697 [Exophiala bonariae]